MLCYNRIDLSEGILLKVIFVKFTFYDISKSKAIRLSKIYYVLDDRGFI